MVWTGIVATLIAALAADADLKEPIAAIRAVGPDGKGAKAAAVAWRELAKVDINRLPELLAGMDGANAVARNWLRSVIERVLEQARAAGKPLPTAALESFLRETTHAPQARRLAYELILERDPTAADRYLPSMLDDPSPELRRDAIARVLDQAEALVKTDKKADALPLFQKALAAARDKEQIDRTLRGLRGLGQTVDPATHLGMVMDWKLIGPFPNAKETGMNTVYPPEQKIDLAGSYDGKAGPVRWTDYVVKQESGIVDLNAGLGQHKEAVAYALTEFTSKKEQAVEIRMSSYTPFKLWLNGKLVLVRGEAYTALIFDQNVARVHFKPGKNQLLLKIVQGDPPPQVPALWQFQLRVCDGNGVAVLSTTRPAGPPAKKS
jgi:hypothetical protein